MSPTKISTILFALAVCPCSTAQLKFAPTPGNYIRVLNKQILIGSHQVSNPLGLYFQQVAHSSLVISPTPSVSVGGSGNDVPLDAMTDPSGNIWIVGNTDSDDFVLVNPIVARKVPYRTAAFVLELDPTASRVLFATYLGGQNTDQPSYASHATALAIDPSGNVYVAGDTNETDFPTTPGTIQLGRPGVTNFLGIYSVYSFSYVAKISPAGNLIYSTFVQSGTPQCTGGSGCIGRNSTFADISSLSVDTAGIITTAGTAGGIQYGIGYVNRLAADASKLIWTVPVGNSFGSVDTLLSAQDGKGNVSLFGRYAPLIGDSILQREDTPGLFTATVSSDGSQLLNVTDFGQSSDSRATGITMDAAGVPYLAGTSSSPKFPSIAGVPQLGADFVYSPSAQRLFRFPTGVVVAPPAFDSAGNLQILGSQGALVTLAPSYAFDSPLVVAFSNAASNQVSMGFYPGTAISIFGFDLPANTTVSVGGEPATVLYSGPTQVNIVVPAGANLSGAPVGIAVSPSEALSLSVPFIQSIGIFTNDGNYAAALNQDGTANSSSNPAAAGSIVSLFGTGFLSQSYVTATSKGLLVPIQSFGPVPGQPGLYQISLRAPSSPASLVIQANSLSPEQIASNPVSLYVH